MTSGNPTRLILKLGIPLLAGNVLQQLYTLVDTVIVGRGIGVDALAAVGLTGSITFLILGFMIGMAQGVGILVSQSFGAQNAEQLRKSVTMSFVLNYTIGLVVTAAALSSVHWILRTMNTPAGLIPISAAYLRIIFSGILVSLSYNFCSGILRALGDSRNPLIAMVLAFIINTLLDLWFVMGLRMGVTGAGLATVIAQGMSALYCFWCCRQISILHLKREDWHLDLAMLKTSFQLSVPVAVMNSITAVGVMILQAAINAFGAVYIAGYSTASKIILLLEQISSTFGFATGTYVGQNLGAGKLDRIRQGVASMQKAVLIMNVLSAAATIGCGRFMIQSMISSAEAEVVDVAYHCLVVLSVFLAALGILWVFRCALQSMSDTFFPMLSGILEFGTRTCCILTLPRWFGFNGVLYSEVSAWMAAALMLGIVYRRRMKNIESARQIEKS